MRVLAVCLGNICRSPIAEAVLRAQFAAASLPVEVDSAGTSAAHAGEDADERALRVLHSSGYSLQHQARQLQPEWLSQRDLVLVMDHSNLRGVRAIAERSGINHDHVRLLREFDAAALAAGELEVPDPWYGGAQGFTDVLQMIERAGVGLVQHLRRHAIDTAG